MKMYMGAGGVENLAPKKLNCF